MENFNNTIPQINNYGTFIEGSYDSVKKTYDRVVHNAKSLHGKRIVAKTITVANGEQTEIYEAKSGKLVIEYSRLHDRHGWTAAWQTYK